MTETADNVAEANQQTLAERLGSGLAIAAMTARLLVPTEATTMGETLWIAAALILAGIIYSFGLWQSRRSIRPDAFSIAITLIVLGHLVSGAWILGGEGQKRWALNVMWEWVSLGATCFVLRGNRSAISVLAAVFVVLSAHGIWQYMVDFPAMRAEYAGVLGSGSEIDQLQAQRALDQQGIPNTEAARKLFADRLASLEPLGPFALTNTLGGFLAAGLLLGVVSLFRSSRSIGRIVVGVLVLAPIAYCLMLTKSRTAVVGVACGLTLFAITVLLNRRAAGKTDKDTAAPSTGARWVGLLCAGVAFGSLLLAVATGGLDEEVISESPKSLQYRLMYWQATSGVIRDSPWLGTGPGNFRQAYTEFKLPASSEEISDPHNMLLDAWCNGGLIALLGLLTLIVVVVRSSLAPSKDDESADSGQKGLVPGLVGFAIVAVYQYFMGQEVSLLSLCLAGGFAVAWYAVRFAFQHEQRGVLVAATFAAVGLMVHLLGAGGFEMPAVMQVVFLLIAAALPIRRVPVEGLRRHTMLLVPGLGLAAFALCLSSAVIPVHRADFLVARGNQRSGRPALKDFSDATNADKYCPRGPDLFARELMPIEGHATYLVIGAMARAQQRDPMSFRGHFALGRAFAENWRQFKDPEDLENAVYHIERAVNRYPTNPRLVGDLAIWQNASEKPEAAETAARALQLDEINRKNGHVDRYLEDEYLSQLIAIAERKNSDTVELGQVPQ